MFAAFEQAISHGSSANVSYVDFRLDHHIGRTSISSSLKLLDHLGLIEIEPGTRRVNIFRFSNRWRMVDEVEAVRLAALAREPKPHRSFERRREAKVLKPATPKPMTVERRRIMQRRVPSLPTMLGRMTDDSRSPDARSGGIRLLTVAQGQTSAFIEKRIVAGPDSLVALAGTFPQRLDMEDFDFSTRVSDHASALKSMRDRLMLDR